MLTVDKNVVAGSSIFFVASPQSPVGAPAAPTTASAKIVCLTTNTIVRADTAVSVVGVTVPITVTGLENEMVDIANTKEKRRLILTCTFGVGDDFVDYVDFVVQRVDLDPHAAV